MNKLKVDRESALASFQALNYFLTSDWLKILESRFYQKNEKPPFCRMFSLKAKMASHGMPIAKSYFYGYLTRILSQKVDRLIFHEVALC